jgi:myo-inositol-1(or 4)-monophosphatase
VTDIDPTELLDLAAGVAAEAASMLAAGRPAGPSGRPEVRDTKSSPTDVVTEMDRASEALIRRRLLAARPGDAVLGEEGGESGRGRLRWVVDSLDGTVNYLYGNPRRGRLAAGGDGRGGRVALQHRSGVAAGAGGHRVRV